jgi:rubrerythrin
MYLFDKLQILIHIEKLMEEVYTRFSEQFSDDPDAPRMFAALAAEEESHVNQIRYMVRMVQRHPHEFEEVNLPMDETRAMVTELKKILESSRGDLSEALQMAIRMESHVLERHSRLILSESNSRLKSLLKSLAGADQQHHDRLYDFAVKKGAILPDQKI